MFMDPITFEILQASERMRERQILKEYRQLGLLDIEIFRYFFRK